MTFPLPNAEHVLAIKTGQVPYEQVNEEIERLRVEVETATLESILPDSPDRQFIDNLVMRYYRLSVLNGGEPTL